MKKVIVQKYGGSSVATTDKVMFVAERVAKKVGEGWKVVVVLSAMGDTTDDLITMAEKVNTNPPSREMDMLLSTGEQVSIALFSMAVQGKGVSAISLTGGQVGIMANSVFRKAKIQAIKTGRLKKELKTHDVVVVAGFQGVDAEDNIVTLGRGGSDLSAVALATVLKAEMCEIFTDVDGVYTTDPRIVATARKIPEISFDEMLELASSGAQVMQARSIEFGKKYNTVIHVRCTFNNNPGTIIREEHSKMEQVLVRGIASDVNEAKITIRQVPDKPGVSGKIFGALARAGINVDMIVQNVSNGVITDLSFTTPKAELAPALKIAKTVARSINKSGEVVSNDTIAKISIVGVGMRSHAGVAATMFKVLGDNGINIQMISTSEIKISVIIGKKDSSKAVAVLHKAFKLDKK